MTDVLYAITRDDREVAAVVLRDGRLTLRSPERTGEVPSLEAAFDDHPVLTTVASGASWSITCAEMPAWRIAERLLGDGEAVSINDTVWLRWDRDGIGFVPDDPHELADDGLDFSFNTKLPGFGSPGGSPSMGLGAQGVGDLWYPWCSEEIDVGGWFRALDAMAAATEVSSSVFGAFAQIEAAFLPEGDPDAIDQLVGPPEENGWRSLWVNGELWWQGSTGWEPATPAGHAACPEPLKRPRSVHVERPERFAQERSWLSYEVDERVTSPPESMTAIVVVPGGASDLDLLRIVHADATQHQWEVPDHPATAIVVDAEGAEWLGVAWIHPDLGARLQTAIPTAVMLLWDDEQDVLVPGDGDATDVSGVGLRCSEQPPPASARARMEQLDPLGSDRFTPDAMGQVM